MRLQYKFLCQYLCPVATFSPGPLSTPQNTPDMLRLLIFALLAIPAVFLAGCHGSGALNQTDFYGSWVRDSSGPKDTLVFFYRNHKNLLRYNNSYNSARPAYTEIEYTVRNEKLYFKGLMYQSASADFVEAQSFTWIEPTRKFRLLGNQLWAFLNAYPLYATFRKLEN